VANVGMLANKRQVPACRALEWEQKKSPRPRLHPASMLPRQVVFV